MDKIPIVNLAGADLAYADFQFNSNPCLSDKGFEIAL